VQRVSARAWKPIAADLSSTSTSSTSSCCCRRLVLSNVPSPCSMEQRANVRRAGLLVGESVSAYGTGRAGLHVCQCIDMYPLHTPWLWWRVTTGSRRRVSGPVALSLVGMGSICLQLPAVGPGGLLWCFCTLLGCMGECGGWLFRGGSCCSVCCKRCALLVGQPGGMATRGLSTRVQRCCMLLEVERPSFLAHPHECVGWHVRFCWRVPCSCVAPPAMAECPARTQPQLWKQQPHTTASSSAARACSAGRLCVGASPPFAFGVFLSLCSRCGVSVWGCMVKGAWGHHRCTWAPPPMSSGGVA
jgi:hypothetical protein